MNMNAADDKEACGSKNGPEYLDNGNSSYTCPIYCSVSMNGNSSDNSSNSKLCGGTTGAIGSKNTLHNDCGKVCLETTPVNTNSSQNNILQNGIVYNGDHPKVRPNLVTCNIPGSSVGTCDIQKMNNNVINGKAEEVNGMDLYMRNNVDYYSNVDKCPPKVRNENARGACHEDWDSSSENEGDEECYIYTYKGDCNQMADLPTSFFKLDVVAPRDHNESRSSSPDMDYLEMDFDPGPSQDRDSSPSPDSECCAMQQNRDVDDGSVTPVCEPEPVAGPSVVASDVIKDSDNQPIQEENSEVSVEPEPTANTAVPVTAPKPSPSSGFSSVPSRFCVKVPRDSWGHHSGSGNLCSPAGIELDADLWNENIDLLHFTPQENTAYSQKSNFHSALYHCIMGKRLVLSKGTTQLNDADEDSIEGGLEEGKPIERTMIWSEQEACAKQVTQVSTSACGTTACINALLALNVSFSFEKLKNLVNTRLRKETAPLPEYLFSRSNAGATHVDIIRGLKGASHGILYARFFHMYPQRNVSLTRWLSYWMKKGAVPIATMNLQRGVEPDSVIPDAWHHQMMFGVGPRGLYLTNPLECVSEAGLWPQLCSPSVLKVRRADVIARWTPSTDLHPLIQYPDPRWKKLNVLGQVVNVIRESRSHQSRTVPGCRNLTSHVTIPAAYNSGITLVIRRESPGYQELRNAPDLPLSQEHSPTCKRRSCSCCAMGNV